MRRVVITGVGVVSPLGHSLSEFADHLFGGVSGARRLHEVFPEFGPDARVAIGAPVRDEPRPRSPALRDLRLHRSERFAAAALQQVLDQCGSEAMRNASLQCGVGIGKLFPDADEFARFDAVGALASMAGRLRSPKSAPVPGRLGASFADFGTVRLARAFGLCGGTNTFVAACAAASQACIHACETIMYGGASIAVGGAHDSLLETAGMYMMDELGTLTANRDPEAGIRPFDIDRDGTLLGEGAAYFAFEEFEHARLRGAQILAEVVGFGSSLDGYHVTSPDPSGDASVRMMTDALAMAKLAPERIDYVNAHGTSTVLNDVIESRIINRALKGHKPYVSGTKAQIGHLIAACGAVELVACLAALEQQRVPPTVNLLHPDPECELRLPIADSPRARIEYVLSNSFGFGGQNACLILRARP